MTFKPQYAKLGEILVHQEIVSEVQIKEALQKQKNFHLKIGQTLQKLGYITEKQLLGALHLQLEYEVVASNELMELDSEIIKQIP